MSELTLVGFDPSLRNWGVAVASYSLVSNSLQVHDVDVIRTKNLEGKKVRNNSNDLYLGTQLRQGIQKYVDAAHAIFVEVPHGSQSSRAMASYGICIGILSCLRAADIPFYELSEREVKLGTVGKTKVSKEEMIEWATTQHPQAPWATHTRQGTEQYTLNLVEHQADAVATIHSGIQLPDFNQQIAFYRKATGLTT